MWAAKPLGEIASRRNEMQMFDEEISTLIRQDGTAEQKRWLTDDMFQSEAMDEARGMFLTAESKFRKLNANADCVIDQRRNVQWWDALERVHRAERRVWGLFVGPQPDIRSNRLYARFRELLLKGSSLKGDA
jgi:hypothetical protein